MSSKNPQAELVLTLLILLGGAAASNSLSRMAQAYYGAAADGSGDGASRISKDTPVVAGSEGLYRDDDLMMAQTREISRQGRAAIEACLEGRRDEIIKAYAEKFPPGSEADMAERLEFTLKMLAIDFDFGACPAATSAKAAEAAPAPVIVP
jgi:hypothetical protein